MRQTSFSCKKLLSLLFVIVFLLSGFRQDEPAKTDREGARKAFELLSDIRTNPSKYYDRLDFLKNEKISKVKLVWNDQLAEAAEWKVLDMIKKKYSSHVDKKGRGMNFYINKFGYKVNKASLKNKKSNYFESLAFGSDTPEEGIIDLIIDQGVPSLGHRKHLLGSTKGYDTYKDVGIAFATAPDSKWETYMCVLIASHDY